MKIKLNSHMIITIISIIVVVLLLNQYNKQNIALQKCRERKVSFAQENEIRVYNPQEPALPLYPDPAEYTLSDRNYGTRQMDAIDRVRNPLRFPYKGIPAFQAQIDFSNRNLPFQVASGGRRMIPTIEGVPIINSPPAIDIGNANIAPTNISTRGGIGLPQQVGVLHKVFGADNEVYPLYGRRRYPRDDKWDYYTVMGNQGVKLEVRNASQNYRNQELNTGDEVQIQGLKDKYRATVYQSDFPEYIPWLPTVPRL